MLVSTAIAIATGATAMADIAVLGQLAPVLGSAPSGSTVRWVLVLATDRMLARTAQAKAEDPQARLAAGRGRRRVPPDPGRGKGPDRLAGHRHGRHPCHGLLTCA